MRQRLLAVSLLALSLPLAAQEKKTILFACPYGGAKSVIAASFFNRLAEEQQLPYVGVAVAAEKPYDAVPERVVDFLAHDDFDVSDFKPRLVEPGDVERAVRVVTIDCKVEGADAKLESWDDVPKLSVDFDTAVGAIRRHVETLAAELRAQK